MTYADLAAGDTVADPKHIELTLLSVEDARTGGKLKMYVFKRIGGDIMMRYQLPENEIALPSPTTAS